MRRRTALTTESETDAAAAERRPVRAEADTIGHVSMAERRAWTSNREQAEDRYVAARDAWTSAMRAASSGRPADLAALALAQEAYEQATAERDRWANGTVKVAIPIDPHDRARNVEAVVGQELAWRQVHADEERASREGPIGRLLRRLRGG
jgi:hypothetical protein